VNKAFWLENFQENTLESGQIRCVHLGVKIWETNREVVKRTETK
jgi:hypothetical protein